MSKATEQQGHMLNHSIKLQGTTNPIVHGTNSRTSLELRTPANNHEYQNNNSHHDQSPGRERLPQERGNHVEGIKERERIKGRRNYRGKAKRIEKRWRRDLKRVLRDGSKDGEGMLKIGGREKGGGCERRGNEGERRKRERKDVAIYMYGKKERRRIRKDIR